MTYSSTTTTTAASAINSTTATTTKQQQQASISRLTEPKRYTRDQIMAMARCEYARQLCVYTKAQLSKGEDLMLSPSTSSNSVSTNPATPPTARMIC
ncbi:uncharacterized protein ATC70_005831 [Mucor velutinosus]|uniref:Uncharacterized protein n=1 Tax=Mucor velutinosus TaxID=708070 RepID=A0AAN7DG49_9FUNG|nr:hypothetical protein ATC70_005831 [Mucor velutinosus]